MNNTILDIFPVIEKNNVLRRLGFNKNKTILTPAMQDLIDQEMARLGMLIKPKVVYSTFNINIANSLINLTETDLSFDSESLSGHLARCEKISIFACTIGSILEDAIQKYFSADSQSRGVLLDAMGSVAVEALAEETNKKIVQKAEEDGYKTVRRFSPGYKDWKLKEQSVIFNLINPTDIGITLTDSFLMKPEKSVTAVIGWHK